MLKILAWDRHKNVAVKPIEEIPTLPSRSLTTIHMNDKKPAQIRFHLKKTT
jgi:hypothetical protein